MRRVGRILLSVATVPFRTPGRRRVTIWSLYVLAIGLGIASHFRHDTIGSHVLYVEDGRVVERWAGLYSGDGRIALGGSSRRDLLGHYIERAGAAPRPFTHLGHFGNDSAGVFAQQDANFIFGFGDVDDQYVSGDPDFHTRRPRGPPVFAWEYDRSFVTIPWWFAILAPPALGYFIKARMRRGRREQPGLCPACGYDCRATPERCPECGMVVAANPKPETRNQNQ